MGLFPRKWRRASEPAFGRSLMREGLGKLGKGIERGLETAGARIRSAGKSVKDMKPVQIRASFWAEPIVAPASLPL